MKLESKVTITISNIIEVNENEWPSPINRAKAITGDVVSSVINYLPGVDIVVSEPQINEYVEKVVEDKAEDTPSLDQDAYIDQKPTKDIVLEHSPFVNVNPVKNMFEG